MRIQIVRCAAPIQNDSDLSRIQGNWTQADADWLSLPGYYIHCDRIGYEARGGHGDGLRSLWNIIEREASVGVGTCLEIRVDDAY